MPDNLTEIVKDITVLKTDMAQINNLVDRLDLTIAKLTEVSTNVSQLIAVQENRLSQQEKTSAQLSVLIEKRRDETSQDVTDLHNRITSAEREFKNEIEKMNSRLIEEMKAIRDENKRMHEEMKIKISQLERFMWVLTGGAAVVGFLISQLVDFAKLFSPN